MNDKNKFDEYIELADGAFEDDCCLQAVDYYKKALEIKEISSDSYANLACCYSRDRMIKDADTFFNKALALDSTNKRACEEYARFLFFQKEEHAKSEKQYHKLLKQYSDRNLYKDFCSIFEYYYEDWEPDYDIAISFLKEGVKKFKNEETLFLAIIQIYSLSNKVDKARKYFNKLLKDGKVTERIYTQNTSLFRKYKNVLGQKNNVDLLIKILNECIANNPSEVWCYTELIKLHSEFDNFNLVITTYQKLFNIDYNNIGNYYDLTKYLLEKEELNKATKYYKVAANINYSKVIFEQAFAFSSPPFNHYIKAIDLYKEVVELNPNNFRAYINMGVCSGFLQQYHESLSYYTKAIEINPYNELAYENSGNAYRKTGDLNKAIAYYQKALNINSKNYRVAGNLGVTYYSLEKYKEALKYYEISIEFSDNQNIQAYYNIALLYNKLKKYKKAIDACQNALDSHSTPSELLCSKYAIFYTLGHSHYCLNKKEKALSLFFTSLKLNENDKDTYIYIGCIYNDFKQLDLAKEYLNRALKLDPQDFCALENLGWSFYLEKDYVTALEYTKKSVKLNPKNADGFYNLGKIYLAQKKEEQAKKIFKKAALLGHKKASKLV